MRVYRTENFTLRPPVYETGAPIGANDRFFLLIASLYNTHIFLVGSNCRWGTASCYRFKTPSGFEPIKSNHRRFLEMRSFCDLYQYIAVGVFRLQDSFYIIR